MGNNTMLIKGGFIIDNPNYPALGELKVEFKEVDVSSPDTQKMLLTMKKAVTLKIVNGGHFTDSTLQEDFGNTLPIPANSDSTFYVSNGSILMIPEKYDINILQILSPNILVDINDLNFISTKIASLGFNNSGAFGNLESFKSFSKMTSYNFKNTIIEGDMQYLGFSTSLISVNFENCSKIFGKIEDFVNNERSQGKTVETSGVFFGSLGVSNITFQGNVLSGNRRIKWDDNSITVV